jgi:hypothetical protein
VCGGVCRSLWIFTDPGVANGICDRLTIKDAAAD